MRPRIWFLVLSFRYLSYRPIHIGQINILHIYQYWCMCLLVSNKKLQYKNAKIGLT